MNDSIKVWAKNELWLYKYFNRDSVDYGTNYQVDSLLCFNAQGDMCFTGVFAQTTYEDATQDDIWQFFGIKIKDQWYFFDGASLVLLREYYQKDTHNPLSFEKMKELAMRHMYWWYIHKSKKGEWEINENFFNEYYEYDGYSNRVYTKAQRDSSWLKKSGDKWSKRNKR